MNNLKKNWIAIANVADEQLQLSLISCRDEVLCGLAQGFSQYFLEEGQVQLLPSREELLGLALRQKNRRETVTLLKELAVPFDCFRFSGHPRGYTDGVSYADGVYKTNGNGVGDYYYRSKKKTGETLLHKGAEWIVVRNTFSQGDGWTFSGHTQIVVPLSALRLDC